MSMYSLGGRSSAHQYVLSKAERTELLRRAGKRKGASEMRIRAEIIVARAAGESGAAIARRLGIGVHTVSSRWRVRLGWRSQPCGLFPLVTAEPYPISCV